MSTPDPAKSRRELIRWHVMLSLNNARPVECHETVILSVIQALFSDATAMELRRELQYLEERDLLTISRDPSGPWRALLTWHGIDIAEYTVDCQPGIARPVKYW